MAQEPWERIAWPEEYLQVMYRDWGSAYASKDQVDIALKFYTRSLELNEDDERSLYLRSKCNLQLAQTDNAFVDICRAGELKKKDVDIDLVKCRALYELNRFEDAKVEMHDDTRIYVGRKVKAFENMIIVLNENFKDSVGVSYGPFIVKSARYFDALFKALERKRHVETRPLWKILKEAGKCDVLSVLEEEEELLSPREIARRERAYYVFNQMYLNRSWKDVIFLRDVRTNATLCWPPSKMSAPFLKQLADTKYKTVKKFQKMLHARSPLYNELIVKFGSKKKMEKNVDIQLNRVQYQTRRNMITILRTIKKLRDAGQVEKLAKYIEEAMGDYVVLKTYRVMPWKFEFVNDVYNTLALAYADRYTNSQKVPDNTIYQNRILVKLGLPTEHKEKPAFVFGDKSTYQEPDAIDYSFIAYKNYLARLERRILFTKYPIEKCYLLHEISRAHLKQQHQAECCSAARKAIEVVKHFNNNLWAFLSYLLIVKANAMVFKLEQCFDALKSAHELAEQIKSPELIAFVETCQEYNNADIRIRKKSRSTDMQRKRKSRTNSSFISMLDNTDSSMTRNISPTESVQTTITNFYEYE